MYPPYIRRDEAEADGGARGRLIKQTRGIRVEPCRKSAGGEPYDLTDLMRYIYDGLLSFPSPTSLPLKETYRWRVPDAADTACTSFPRPCSHVLLSISLSLSLPLELASPGFPSRPLPSSFDPLTLLLPVRFECNRSRFSPAENGPSATLSARDDVGLIKFRSFH